LTTLFPRAADTDTASVASAGGGQQDFASDYCQGGLCNLRRVLTVPVVDSTDSLNVLNFRQFLLEPSPASAVATQGIDPTVANGSFRAQYLGAIVPVRSGSLGGSCSVNIGVGKVVLH